MAKGVASASTLGADSWPSSVAALGRSGDRIAIATLIHRAVAVVVQSVAGFGSGSDIGATPVTPASQAGAARNTVVGAADAYLGVGLAMDGLPTPAAATPVPARGDRSLSPPGDAGQARARAAPHEEARGGGDRDAAGGIHPPEGEAPALPRTDGDPAGAPPRPPERPEPPRARPAADRHRPPKRPRNHPDR